jgi:hypothetical protein
METTHEVTLEEYIIGDDSVVMVLVQEFDEEQFYSVRYLVNRKFGFKTFWKMSEAEQFYNQIKAQVVLEEIKKMVKTS